MTDGRGHDEGTPDEHVGWQPTPQGEYDMDATAFVDLTEGFPDGYATDTPLAAPGHGFVPPPITVAPAAGATDPAATGTWTVPTGGAVQWPRAAGQHTPAEYGNGQQGGGSYGSGDAAEEPAAYPQQTDDFSYGADPYGEMPYGIPGYDPAAYGGQSYPPPAYREQDTPPAPRQTQQQPAPEPQPPSYGYQSGATGQWQFPQDPQAAPAPRAQSPSRGMTQGRQAAGASAAGAQGGTAEATGQWSFPVAEDELPDDPGEFTASPPAAQWGTAPATLPGGAPAPWASAPEPETSAGSPVAATPDTAAPSDTTKPSVVRVPGAVHEPAPGPESVPEEQPAGQARELSPDPASAQPSAVACAGTFDEDHPTRSLAAQERAMRAARAQAEHGVHPAHDRPAPATPADAATPAGGEPAAGQAALAGDEGPATAAGAPAEAVPVAGEAVADGETAAEGEAGSHDAGDAEAETSDPHPVSAGNGEPAEDQAAPEAQAPTEDETPEDETPAQDDAPVPPPHDEHPLVSYVLRVNDTERPVAGAWIGESLLYVLRERLGLAGAKDGCSQGECGACNVQVDGRLVASCLVPAATTAGSEVRTVEGLAADGQPSDVQRALAACGAVQCGYCVPGMAMTVHDLLEGNPSPTELEARQALCGNLCRCSGYRGVLDAVREVAEARATQHGEPAAAPQEGTADAEADPAAVPQPRFGPPAGATIPHQAPPGAGGVHPAPDDPYDDLYDDGGRA
ncbi:2Fe-2S iron-sulfur cluster-binding protein [Streptomyces sp. NPDC058045]|uniref:2Fe-2S iron-sulfur cluster-binding protein n=1 Tax=Streptomyces sp. NPDC058045 TaxID=3346311 RepID=UPI0036E289FA